MALETLENRRLFAVNFGLVDGLLTVEGTAAANVMNIGRDGSNLVITVDGETEEVAEADVERIVMQGRGQKDTMSIDSGIDINATLNGGAHRDTITGGDGDDFIWGHVGNDELNGGAGNDTLKGFNGDDNMHGGEGIDKVTYAYEEDSLEITLDDAKNDGVNGEDNVHSDVENIRGGAGNDLLEGNDEDNIIAGGAGRDTLIGGDGSDTLFGQRGRDELHSIDGEIDTLDGGSFIDEAQADDDDELVNIEAELD